jgi:polar amino acid transport system substrate-binding protein
MVSTPASKNKEPKLKRALAIILSLSLFISAPAGAASPTPEAVRQLAPTGVLRAAINYGNPVLAQRDPAGLTPHGVSADIARALAERLGVQVQFVAFDSAGETFEAAKKGLWDIAFLAIDPKRAEGLAFSAPYVSIEGVYLVPDASPLRTLDGVDREGVQIAVGQGSAYDLFLQRSLKHAKLRQAPTSAAALDLFLQEHLDAAAGVRQPVQAFAASHPGLRVLPGSFMAINQAVATPKERQAAAAYLYGFVEELKASGFIAHSLAASGQSDAEAALPAPKH